MRICTLAALLASVPSAQPRDNDLAKQELKKLQGAWVLVAYEEGGKMLPPEKVRDVAMTARIKGAGYTLAWGQEAVKGRLTLDPSKTPKHLDAQFERPGGEKGKTVGIYELDGDTLRVCFAPEGKERPTAFRTQPGSDQVMQTFRKEKSK
jgi:uncharacterized protein (TIGR03067 family)